MRVYLSALGFILFAVAVVFIGLMGRWPIFVRWVLIMAVAVLALGLIGKAIPFIKDNKPTKGDGRWDGVLIDPQNRINLSRLQTLLWTIVVLSAWATLALHRVIPLLDHAKPATDPPVVAIAKILAKSEEPTADQRNQAVALLERLSGETVTYPDDSAAEPAKPARVDPLDIAFPQDVWLLLGVSLASLTAAGFINANMASEQNGQAYQMVFGRKGRLTALDIEIAPLVAKRDKNDPALTPAETRQLEQLEASKAMVESQIKAMETRDGELQVNETLADARWTDMVRGDTISNFQYPEVGKIQMFFFTIILVFAYGALLTSLMTMPGAEQILRIAPKLTFPGFSASAVIVLAISHAGYLAAKGSK